MSEENNKQELFDAQEETRELVEKIVPVPEGIELQCDQDGYYKVYKPKEDKFSKYQPPYAWEWFNEKSESIGYVHRLEFTDKSKNWKRKKLVCPILYGETKRGKQWCMMSYGKNRPLFNLDSIARHPDSKIVYLAEGELCAKLLEKIVQAPVVCTQGGSKTVHLSDLSSIQNKEVVIIPDNDAVGRDYANQVKSRLAKLGNFNVHIANLSEGKPDGWDIADDISNGSTSKEDIELRIEKALLASTKESIQANPILVPLGVDGDAYYYITGSQLQIRSITNHNKNNLLSLAPLDYFKWHYPKSATGISDGVDWTQAASDLMERCRSKHIFNPNRKRGLGCWIDEDRVVYHVGPYLIVDGQKIEIIDFLQKSQYIHEAMAPLIGPAEEPLSNHEKQLIVDAINSFPWANECNGILLAGFLTLAPIGGALEWRSHFWITGSPGTGKSTLCNELIKPLFGNAYIYAQGGTSEAGIRQSLECSSIPVIYDEAEPKNKAGKARLENILMFIRTASQNAGKILKGGASHVMKEFSTSSMFLLASTTVSTEDQADKSRFIILDLVKLSNQKKLEELKSKLAQIDSSWAPRLLTHSINHVSVINANAKKLSDVIFKQFRDKRLGDLVGYPLAGYYSLLDSGLLDDEQCEALVNTIDVASLQEASEISQEQSILHIILQYRVRCNADDEKTDELSIGQILARIVGDRQCSAATERLHSQLMSYGLKYLKNKMFAVANNSEFLKKVFENTSTPANWNKVLSRLEGAKSNLTINFGPGFGRAKGVKIPLDLCYSEDIYGDIEDDQDGLESSSNEASEPAGGFNVTVVDSRAESVKQLDLNDQDHPVLED